MNDKPNIIFLTGGTYHPTTQQADIVTTWLGPNADCQLLDGALAFDSLDDADLFVAMGTHFTGMMYPGAGSLPYYSPTAEQRIKFERYVASGKPLLAHHGCVLSYDDWPRFSHLMGFYWDWQDTKITPVTQYLVHVKDTGHPIVRGVKDFVLEDEVYIDVAVTPGLEPVVHAAVYIQNDIPIDHNGHSSIRSIPLVLSVEGGRTPGAGKLAYLVNGHQLDVFLQPEIRQLWLNTIDWLLS